MIYGLIHAAWVHNSKDLHRYDCDEMIAPTGVRKRRRYIPHRYVSVKATILLHYRIKGLFKDLKRDHDDFYDFRTWILNCPCRILRSKTRRLLVLKLKKPHCTIVRKIQLMNWTKINCLLLLWASFIFFFTNWQSTFHVT